MAIGLSSKLNVLQRSPHDSCGSKQVGITNLDLGDERIHWVPSRYNVRAMAEDGRMVLWNSLSGSMNAFDADKVPLLTKALRKPGFEARKTGMVKYLVDRGYLVEAGTDEFRTFQHRYASQQFRTDILQLMLMPSEDCNFRCHYCYEDFARGTMKPEVRSGIKKLADQRVPYLKTLVISWFGGEPLYGWEAIQDLAPHFRTLTDQHGVRLNSQMTTNGFLLTPDVADKLLAWGVTSYQITVDGSPEDHDRNRPTREGKSSFWQIFDNLRNLAKRDDQFRVTLRTNVDRDNFVRMPAYLEMLEGEFSGDPRFQLDFHPVAKWGGDNDDSLAICGTDKKTMMDELHAAAQSRGLSLKKGRLPTALGAQVCYAARPYHFLIGAAGQVMKCTILLDKDPANIVGRITESGELQIRDDRIAQWTEPAYERDTHCKKCVFLPSCAGSHCPLPRIQSGRRGCVSQRSAPKVALLRHLQTHEGFDSGEADADVPI